MNAYSATATAKEFHFPSFLLTYRDFVEVILKDEDGKAIPNEDYVACTSDGEIRKGKLDQNGYAKINKVSAGSWKPSLRNRGEAYEED